MENSNLILKVDDLRVILGKDKIINDLSFKVHRGDSVAVIGPNGAGKTTLFKALMGMIPYAGKIQWQEGIRIGYVPQRMEIETDIPLSVSEFLYLRQSKGFDRQKAKEAVKSVLLPEEILDKGLGEISVGQRQRILIAWALLGDPEVLLFDEPTADIDISGQESIYHLLHDLQRAFNLTMILISHDLNIVYQYANEVLCLNRTKVCFGPPQEMLGPEQMQKLYGGKRAIYQHFHLEDNHHKHGG